ncbi:Lrp/AsnC family transcriptional regulator [Herbaspirillum sp. ST 5-3]|uniref:siroheme decarboxylase subunit beta n=1 Tax=Oxalobacteraceae TaxID=75682 RepID=UPI0010A4A791|nr:Lrp/AsnC family transcriptional regulator [Herbaspirillum sp. ST 5-3]
MPFSQSATLSERDFALVNAFQRDFPLLQRPFSALADMLDTDEATVISSLQRLQNRGVISRVGAVFRPNAIGASTLAALSVPAERLDDVAAYINALPEVNHNYEREHRYNLWFVATAPSRERLRAVMQEIEDHCDCGTLLVLPMLQDYHIDLGFDLACGTSGREYASAPGLSRGIEALSEAEQGLIAALQDGLPLVARPFEQLGVPEAEAIETIARWLDRGVIKRFGVIVRHHELGYTANAMAVWDVPDDIADDIGRGIASNGCVTLCYRRVRQLPQWRYNLFCMVHGKDRAEVAASVAALSERCGLASYPHEVLFSCRRFKQRGAHYVPVPEVAHG